MSTVASEAIACWCVELSVAASATTRVTGSLALLPNSTADASRTHDIPVRCTASEGRACGNAKPGASTM